MVALRFSRFTIASLVFAFGVAVVGAAQPDKDKEEELKRLAEVQRRLQLELQLRAQKTQPKGQPKVAPKPLPAPLGGMPDGAIARLGDSRLRHAGLPTCVVFSPDGKRVFSGGEDSMLRVWDANTGESLNTLNFPDASLRRVRFTHGGTKLAVQLSDSRVRFLNPDTLKEISEFAAEYGNDFATSADGTLIAHFANNGLLRVTELKTGLEMLEVTAGTPFAFRPDGKTIAVSGSGGKVTVYMIAGGKPVMTFDHGTSLNGLVFSPDGKLVATGGADGTGTETVKVWDLSDAKNPKMTVEIPGVSRPRTWLDNDKIAAAGAVSAGIYDISKKRWIGQAKGIAGEWAISPDGTKAASTGTGGLRIRMWDLTTGKQLHAENDTFPDTALLAPGADGQSVFVLAGEAAFNWPISRNTAQSAGTLPARAVHAETGGGRLVVATPEAVLVYDEFDPAKPLPAKPARTLTENAKACRAIAISPDGKKVAYSGGETKTTIADAATGKVIRTLPIQTVGLALAFTPDGEKLAMIGRDGFLRLWSAGSVGDEAQDLWKVRIQRGQKGTIAVSPDGKLIAASSSGMVKIVDTTDGSEVFAVGSLFEYGLFQHIAFSQNGRLLITSSEGMGGGVQVWEIATRTLVHRFSTGFGTVYRIGVFADGMRVASAGAEEAITVWDLTGRNGKEPPKTDELLTAWGQLDSIEGVKGYPALQTLVLGGGKSIRVMTAGLEEMHDTQKKIEQWAKNLGAEEFDEREAATKELIALGFRALPAVQMVAATSESAEAKKRANEILTQFAAKGVTVPSHGLAGDPLRLVRAVQVLEEIGGPEAKTLVERIATMGGAAAEAAKAALKKWDSKK
jgi:WD40 repeat protein